MRFNFKRRKHLIGSLLLMVCCGNSLSFSHRYVSDFESQGLRHCRSYNPYLEWTATSLQPQCMLNGTIEKTKDYERKSENQHEAESIEIVAVTENVSRSEPKNATAILNDSIIQEKEAMPSFDEWKKAVLEHQEPLPTPPKEVRPESPKSERKKGRRNYASVDCGAKLVAANDGAEGASNILQQSKDVYMLNPCKSLREGGMWFIIELCESIHPTHLELANFELFSSTAKNFVVYMGDHSSSEEWTRIGEFEMAQLKTLQTFPLDAAGFGKAIKVVFSSVHETNQYYCPLSLAQVFGNSMVDDFVEKVSEVNVKKREDELKPIGNPQVIEPVATDDPKVADLRSAVVNEENVYSRARKAVDSLISSVSKAVKGTLESNCTDCRGQSTVVTFEQSRDSYYDGCYVEPPSKNGSETHLWPSMKCRFALAANVQRNCKSSSTNLPTEALRQTFVSRITAETVTVRTDFPVITEGNVASNSPNISPTSTSIQRKISTASTELNIDEKVKLSELLDPSPRKEVEKSNSVNAPDVNKMNAFSAPPSAGSAQPTVPLSFVPKPNGMAQKENLFSRFESRIKQLEINMNLSGTYLEELSKRYRNQMEEMQAAFNKTVAVLNMEAKKGVERDHNQQIVLAALEEKLATVTDSLEKLQADHSSLWWRLLLTYFALLTATVAVFVIIFHLLMRRMIGKHLSTESIHDRETLRMLREFSRARELFESQRSELPQSNLKALPTISDGLVVKSEEQGSDNQDIPQVKQEDVPETETILVKAEPSGEEAGVKTTPTYLTKISLDGQPERRSFEEATASKHNIESTDCRKLAAIEVPPHSAVFMCSHLAGI